jgi:hypothetical protein
VAARALSELGAGAYSVRFAEGARLTPGVYFLRLTQGADVATRKACVLE